MLKIFTNSKINDAKAYLLINDLDHKAILVDTAALFDEISQYIDENGLVLTDIFITHYHYDHTMWLGNFKEKYNSYIHIGANDFHLLISEKHNDDNQNNNKEKYKMLEPNSDKVDLLTDTGTIVVNSFEVSWINIGGHTPGSMFYIINNKYAFVGDTLFKETLGYNTKKHPNLKHCDDNMFFASIEYIIDNFKDYAICPGHFQELFSVNEILANSEHEYFKSRS